METTEIRCFLCGAVGKSYAYFRVYHGDQDDMICPQCAAHTTHSDTAYSGMNVLKSGTKGL